ncbi:hypothetical protein [Hyalangium gracile]|uniref:hypothetical protein n=1 Tax=Hyalangium gracile TaxID=394092 RepID=UPI001CCED1EE|nr:hypothetical protein [Hyalangium gracile]
MKRLGDTWGTTGVAMFVFLKGLDHVLGKEGSEAALPAAWRLYERLQRTFTAAEDIARLRQFEHLPAGSLGREFWEYCQRHGFPLPGQPGAIPFDAVRHDVIHLMAGYGPDREGELLLVAFCCGFFGKRRPHSTGRQVVGPGRLMYTLRLPGDEVPATVRHMRRIARELGRREGATVSEARVERAYERGRAMTVDLLNGWDYLLVAHRPLEELRRRYGILPE